MIQSLNQSKLFALIDKFLEGDLSELTLKEEEFSLTLKKGPGDSASWTVGAPAGWAAGAPAGAGQGPSLADSSSGADAGNSTDTGSGADVITSPIVGTFYRSPAPDAPVFIEEGASVARGDSLCIIEAMKIMNKLEADFACTIVKILVEDGQMVEYGTPLFEVKKA